MPMSSKRKAANAHAAVFAALGDETRLLLLDRLYAGEPRSISQLTEGTRLSRQAVTKHLRALQRARILRCKHVGRESLFEFDPRPLQDLQVYLDAVSKQWDGALTRLKAFVENNDPT